MDVFNITKVMIGGVGRDIYGTRGIFGRRCQIITMLVAVPPAAAVVVVTVV